MMNGIWFDNIHSFNDLNLVLSKVEIPPATPKTNFVEIPGADGSVDLTEAHGKINYNDRDGAKFTFTVFPFDDFEEKKKQVSNLLNGQRKKVIVDKDPDYFWDGRCSVDSYASDKNLHQIVISAKLAPYKLKKHLTRVVVPSGENNAVCLTNGRKTAVPTIICTADTTIVFNGNTFSVNAGTHKILNIELFEGDNHITVTSTGSVEFNYQEGDL